jgi:2-haloacid dehalogenase
VAVIRQADPAELESALGVWRAANVDSQLPGHLEHLRGWAGEDGARVFVAAEGERLVGVAFSLPGRAADGAGPVVPGQRHLTGFAVIPERQRHGIGRSLLSTALEDARREGCARVTLWTHAANAPARKLFEAAGFLPTGRSEPDANGAEMLQLECVRAPAPRYDAVLFDLFTALLDSEPLWREVAGGAAAGARWRAESSRVAYSAGRYRPFVETVAEAAQLAGVPPTRAADLLRGMEDQLGPWPEAPEVLRRLSERVRIGVVTNCSEELGQLAAARVGVHFDTVVTAEAAGAYKGRLEPYRLALERLAVQPSRALFVAGSPGDITGARGAGMDVCWHNRLRLPLGEREPPLAELDSLEPLLVLVSAPRSS